MDFDLSTIDDNLAEGSEDLTITLGSITGGGFEQIGAGSDNAVTTNIVDETVPTNPAHVNIYGPGELDTLHVTNMGHSNAGYNNTFGYFVMDDDGNPVSGEVLFSSVRQEVGVTKDIEGVDADKVGYFIISNGAALNSSLADGAELTFTKNSDGTWTAYADGVALSGQVLFSESSLNANGQSYVKDSSATGNSNWEDTPGGGDNDFNDVNMQIDRSTYQADSIPEGRSGTFTVTLDQTPTEDVTVELVYSGVAEDGTDFTATHTVTIAAGQQTATFDLYAIDDNLVEGDEIVTVSIGTISGGGFEAVEAGANNSATATIVDNDAAVVSISGPDEITEGDSGVYTISLTNPVANDVVVQLVYTGTATDGTDYTSVASVTIAAGSTSVDFDIATIDDNIAENCENFTVTLGNISAGSITAISAGADDSVTTKILDESVPTDPDDQTALVSIAGPDQITEGESGTFTVSLSQTPTTDVTVQLTYSGTATDGSDYTAVTSVVIAAGTTSVDFNLATIDDNYAEGSENVVISVGNISGGGFEDVRAGAEGSVTTAIVDETTPVTPDDQTALVNIYGPGESEGITVTNMGDVTAAFSNTFGYYVMSDDGTPQTGEILFANVKADIGVTKEITGVDADKVGYFIIPNGFNLNASLSADAELTFSKDSDGNWVAFAGGVALSGAVLFSNSDLNAAGVNYVMDALAELGNSNWEDLIGGGDFDFNDVNMEIDRFTYDASQIREGDTGTFTVTLDQVPTEDVTVQLTYSGVAIDGTDFTSTHTVTIAAGQQTATFDLYAIDDNLVEGDEIVNVSITSVTGGGFEDIRAGDHDTATATIIDDDISVISVTAVQARAVEEDGSGTQQNAVFAISMSNPSAYDTTMVVSVAPRGTTAGIDGNDASSITVMVDGKSTTLTWDASANAYTGNVTFPAGVTSAELTLVAADDGNYEGLEKFTVSVTDAATNGMDLNDASAKGTIVDSFKLDTLGTISLSEEGLHTGNADNTGSPDTTNATEASGQLTMNGGDALTSDITLSLSAPTTAYTSNGVPVTWYVSSDGHTLVGKAGSETIATVTLNNDGQYHVELKGALDHADTTTEDALALNIGVTATSTTGVVSQGSIALSVEDDSPVAVDQSAMAYSTPANINITLAIDISGSMNSNDVDGYNSRLDAAQQVISKLIDQYGEEAGNVRISIVAFASDSQIDGDAWVDLVTAKSIIAQLQANGGTDYDSAVASIEALYTGANADKMLTDAQNVLYFISDGEPNEDNNTGTLGLIGQEVSDWQNFLIQNSITAYALGVSNSYMDSIAFDGVTASNMLSVGLGSIGDLLNFVVSTITVKEGTGNLAEGGFGADGGNVLSLTMDGVTYTYDADTKTISTSDGSTADFDDSCSELSIEGQYGTLTVNMETGSYDYTPTPGLAEGKYSESVSFTLTDNDGDTSSANLNLGVTVAKGGLTVDANVDANITGSLGSDVIVGDTGGVTTTTSGYANYNISLILDVSGSMKGDRLTNMKTAVNSLLSQLANYEGAVNIQITAFAGVAHQVLQIDGFDTTDLAAAQAAVTALVTGNTTNYEAAFTVSNNWFASQTAEGYTASADYSNTAFFLTDGEPKAYTNTTGGVSYNDYEAYLEGHQAYNNLVSSGVTVNAVGMGIASGSTAGAVLTQFDSDGTPDYVADSHDATDLTAVLQGALTVTIAKDMGSDTISGGDGDDIIFGDSVNSDHLSWTGHAAGTHDGMGYDGLVDYLTELKGGTAPTDDELRNYIMNNADSLNDDSQTNGGNDILSGGDGNDIIYGQGGDDTLIGGKGDDILHGGQGSDTFVWQQGDQGTVGNASVDVVADFNLTASATAENHDVLDLSDLLPDTQGQDLTQYLHFEKSDTDTVVYVSTEGKFTTSDHSDADQVITLKNVDISSAGSSDAEIISHMLNNQQLVVDHT
ncbi:immunoglobulin-like domain-containing protein [Pokkaliibacter sp. CJK22405]|uniref:immunoglobulin-like domain-containing protein n=1 Tax=Pokkaliibacter sp. CJK22405 TaxID=3384615 RepID=UPI003985064E